MKNNKGLIFFGFIIICVYLAQAYNLNDVLHGVEEHNLKNETNIYSNYTINDSYMVNVTNASMINLTSPDNNGHWDYVTIKDGVHSSNFGRLTIQTKPYIIDNNEKSQKINSLENISGNTITVKDNLSGSKIKDSYYKSLIKEHIILDHPVDEIGYSYNMYLKDWTIFEDNKTYICPASNSSLDIKLDGWGNVLIKTNNDTSVVIPVPTAKDAKGVNYTLAWELDKDNKILKIKGLDSLKNVAYPLIVDPTEMVVNGGFETGSLTGWTITQGSPTIGTGNGCHGNYYCVMTGEAITMYQSINFNSVPTVSFYAGGTATQPYHFDYYVDNTQIFTMNSIGWIAESIANTYTNQHDIKFRTTANCNYRLDDVSALTYVTVASFIQDHTSISMGNSVQFTDTSSDSPTSWSWNFGDGGSSNILPSNTKTFSSGGFTSSGGTLTWDTTTKKSGVSSGKFVTTTNGDHFLESPFITVTGNTVYTASNYIYGNIDADCRIIYFDTNNNYITESSGTSVLANGTWQRITNTFTTPSNCNKITFRVQQPNAGTNYYDEAQLETGLIAQLWNENLQSPSHTYTVAGSRLVTLTATNAYGTSSVTHTTNVLPPTPTADFTPNTTSGTVPITIGFSDTTSQINNNMIINPSMENTIVDIQASDINIAQSSTYAHTGTKSLSSQNVVSGASYVFVGDPNLHLEPDTQYYYEAWVYSPTTTNINPSGDTVWTAHDPWYGIGTGSIDGNSNYQTLPGGVWKKISGVGTTSSATTTSWRMVLNGPMSDSTHYDTTKTIYWDDLSVYPVTWSWNFADGGANSTIQNPTRTYTVPGNYSVAYTTTNPAGSSTVNKMLYLSDPACSISSTNSNNTATSILNNTYIKFNVSTTNARWINWSINNNVMQYNNSTNYAEFTNTFATGVNNSVKINVSNYNNNVSYTFPSINVYNLTQTNFTSNVTFGTSPFNVQFNDTSVFTQYDTPPTYQWNFGDGTANSTLLNPTHSYANGEHNYNISLTVTNPACSVTKTVNNYISTYDPIPVANFTSDIVSGLAPLTVQFTDASTALNVTGYQWNFGDGTVNSTLKNPNHIFVSSGVYTISETVTNIRGSSKQTKNSYIWITNGLITPVISPIGNWDFENWSSGINSFPPSNWLGSGSGVSRSNVSYLNNYSYQITGDGVTPTIGLSYTPTQLNINGNVTIDAYVNITNLTHGKLIIDLQGGSPAITSGSLTINSNTAGWQHFTKTINVNSNNPYIRIYGDGTLNNNAVCLVDSITVSKPHTFADFEADNKTYLSSNVLYNPDSLFNNAIFVMNYTNYRLGIRNVTSNFAQIDGVNVTSFVRGENIFIDVSGLPVGSHDISTFTYYNPILPVANFMSNNRSSYVTLPVYFIDTSIQNPDSWEWDFGDGSANSTLKNPSHIYNVAGNYTVTLTSSNYGGNNTIVKTSYIKVGSFHDYIVYLYWILYHVHIS